MRVEQKLNSFLACLHVYIFRDNPLTRVDSYHHFRQRTLQHLPEKQHQLRKTIEISHTNYVIMTDVHYRRLDNARNNSGLTKCANCGVTLYDGQDFENCGQRQRVSNYLYQSDSALIDTRH